MNMTDINSPKFDELRNWIRKAFKHGYSWESITLLNQEDLEGLEKELERRKVMDFWPKETTVETWLDIVLSEEEAEKRRQELDIRKDKAMLTDKSEDNDVSVPTDQYSSWVLYKNYLIESGWNKESIEEIESATLQILRRLNGDTRGQKAVKGLVVGHVQSGKTANMAALMAMAADWGWNMFIVLSGTIENLRKQTQSRLFNDLNRYGNIDWTGLEHLSPQSSLGQRLQDLNFDGRSKKRYFTVCLKNSTRLANLIKWMQADKNKLAQMKIIVIDDEADQGGINTAKISGDERSKINDLIVNLVEGKTHDGKEFDGEPLAMNYIGYTATPYANFLNESHPESLYPSSFIRTLQPSNEYFGAKQIFGIEGTEDSDGLDIIRSVDDDSLEDVKLLHNGQSSKLPKALIDSLAWFLCAASAMRVIGHQKPISMLVHTSQKQDHHQRVANSIEKWLKQETDKEQLLCICKEVWERETAQFTVESFRQQFPDYPNADAIKDYPSFEEIRKEIIKLVSYISHIPLNEDKQMEYHSGIHLCIDNCSNNGVNDENMVVRLAYPDPALPNYPKPAPVFIVIGGNTLSRGLTIEGLVSTFFLRASNQADSLMQMGRWFGYRKGYEMYPRIWMTDKTREKFEFLAQLEHELREDLRRFMDAGADPTEYGPRVKNSPKVSWLRITSPNKMKSAIEADMDFSGTNVQTVVFSEESSDLLHNIEITEKFLDSLGNGERSYSNNSVVWRNVEFDLIKNGLLINKYRFHPRASVFNQIDAFCDWYEKSAKEAKYTGWNVVAAGTKVNHPSKVWQVPGGSVGKINRTRLVKKTYDKSVSIGVLRAPKDLFEDIQANVLDPNELKEISKSADNEIVRKIREKAGLGATPLLILYRIDKDSRLTERSGNNEKKSKNIRADLSVPVDIIGISLWIPGVKSQSFVKTLTVKINKQDIDIEDETGEFQ